MLYECTAWQILYQEDNSNTNTKNQVVDTGRKILFLSEHFGFLTPFSLIPFSLRWPPISTRSWTNSAWWSRRSGSRASLTLWGRHCGSLWTTSSEGAWRCRRQPGNTSSSATRPSSQPRPSWPRSRWQLNDRVTERMVYQTWGGILTIETISNWWKLCVTKCCCALIRVPSITC